jgi:hypothetical protein
MTRRSSDASSASRRVPERVAGEELALLVLAVLVLVVPALLRGGCTALEADLERGAALPTAIDVHSAPWYEWALLDGIGEARARRIADFVAARRPLASLDQLAEVPGLPAGWLDRARPLLRLDAPPEGRSAEPETAEAAAP